MNIHSARDAMSPVRKPKSKNSAKREAVLDAALDLFAQFGYHGTAVPQVAERARVGAGTVYRYFDSKEALVNALFQKWKGELGRVLMEGFPLDQPTRVQFREIWRRLAIFAGRHPKALDFLELHHHQSYLDERSIAVERELLQPLYAFVIDAQEKFQIKKIDPAVIGAIVWGSFMGLVQAARKGYLELSRKTLESAEEAVWEAVRR
jgi:AcrR family transcriptional regulator